MQLIVRNGSNVVLYMLNDAEKVSIGTDSTVIGNPATRIIQDCTSGNSTLVQGVTDPGDWVGWKYLWTGAWELNPDYTPPELVEP